MTLDGESGGYKSPARRSSLLSNRNSFARESSPSRMPAGPQGYRSPMRRYLGHTLTPKSKEELAVLVRNAKADTSNVHIENLETVLKDKCLELEQYKGEVRILSKEIGEREKALELANLDLEIQNENLMKATGEKHVYKSEALAAQKERKQALDELKRANVKSDMADRAYKAIEEKQANVRDLQSYADKVFQLEQENATLTKDLSARSKDLRASGHALSNMELDMEAIMEKAKKIQLAESQNVNAELESQLKHMDEERRMLERQVKVLNAGNLDASFNRAEEPDLLQSELIHMQSEVKRLKGKLDLTERRVMSEARTAEVANSRLDLMNEILQKGSQRRYRHITPARSIDGRSIDGRSETGHLSPPHIGTPASSITGFSTLNEDEPMSEVKSELGYAENVAVFNAIQPDTPGSPAQFSSTGGVPSHLFELLQKEVFSLRQDLRERDRLLTDKDVVVESMMRKNDQMEKVRELEQRRFKRDITEMKIELKSLRGDKPAPPKIGRPVEKWNL
mmetsp:Transcript_23062/g.38602  ORF Transcript_23062/g.38602 Transcript_23062/m.38602 type:complete len:510 (-) Transcript_23062:605-2134(-)|eukprot:CAMPEP_0198212796 /NCGR_PEP_ID=MMETSP1445-20131203/27679_1 /TAXON_ID=36898 /ORGANISM="Pyramimonas sp., Strain CCMP2087" /LENGTH=509 /DNA_ID=CAMNT_0043887333 /DNA_START=422 /DNA_END=1951 /DNA_ORIENTATION=-